VGSLSARNQPECGGVENEAHLIGGSAVTRHAVRRQLRLMQLDQVFHLPALAVNVFVKLTGAREKVAKKTYIRAAKYPNPAFEKALAECKADKSWRTFETTASGHDVMVDAPEWLADILLQVS